MADAIRSLRPLAEPIVNALALNFQTDILATGHRIVIANTLNKSTVTRFAFVCYHYVIERIIFAACSGKSYYYHLFVLPHCFVGVPHDGGLYPIEPGILSKICGIWKGLSDEKVISSNPVVTGPSDPMAFDPASVSSASSFCHLSCVSSSSASE